MNVNENKFQIIYFNKNTTKGFNTDTNVSISKRFSNNDLFSALFQNLINLMNQKAIKRLLLYATHFDKHLRRLANMESFVKSQ